MAPEDSPCDLATLLAAAREEGTLISTPPVEWIPTDSDAAFDVQHQILARRGQAIAGWKIGAKSPDGPIQGAPLPEGAVRRQPGTARRSAHPILGLELELAFRFRRAFEPADRPYSSEEVLQAISSVAAAIEVVSSRFAPWPKVDKLLQLADLQNHGALIVGDDVPCDANYPFLAPSGQFKFDGERVYRLELSNPAGDPRRLLVWLVNHSASRGLTVTPDMWLTTGSYTGIHFPTGNGLAVGKFEGIPEVRVAIE
jgi:2-keto-4-pentenoate hydratase